MTEFSPTPNADPNAEGLITCPVIPSTGAVVFPGVVAPVTVTPDRGLDTAQNAIQQGHTVLLLTLREGRSPQPDLNAYYPVGTEVALGQMVSFPDTRRTVLVQGRRRVEVLRILSAAPDDDANSDAPPLSAVARILEDSDTQHPENEVLAQTILNLYQHAADLGDTLGEELVEHALNIQHPGWLADFVTSTLTLPLADRQRILATHSITERLRDVARILTRELNMLELRSEIDDEIQDEMNRIQREMYLREQMRVIQTELGEDDPFQQEISKLYADLEAADLPDDIKAKASTELSRLAMMPAMAPEVTIVRSYIDWLINLPWRKRSQDRLDIAHAQRVLDAEHYGLDKIKDRVLEHIAVRKLAADKMKTPILCFLGPPGVGKTSLGRSIAHSLGREFVRVSLGGIRDEAEIRGHRRTYIGALPGRILQTMRRAGTINPVFMLDEIDKIGADFRGDPAAALLEVLDPEQNHEFSDHYLDQPYDLSQVMFITTANDLWGLPDALVDRLEVIEFPGYSEEEKLAIAQQFLIPQQLTHHGLSDTGLKFETSALQTIIREYTYEAGVRGLNREIATCCRKVARLIAEDKKYPRRLTAAIVSKYLGTPQFLPTRVNREDSVGVATGLAWTWGGGDVLTIEATLLRGGSGQTLTGQMGEVMRESAQIAHTYTRSRAKDFDVPRKDFNNYEAHVHMPEGAVPKEGPSAGVTLAITLISLFTERPVRANFAMTGEITLRGRILPVGGIREKVLAARRAQISDVVLPAQNAKDLEELPPRVLRDLNVHLVEDMQEVIDLVLLPPPPDGRLRDLDPDDEDDEDDDETGEDT